MNIRFCSLFPLVLRYCSSSCALPSVSFVTWDEDDQHSVGCNLLLGNVYHFGYELVKQRTWVYI